MESPTFPGRFTLHGQQRRDHRHRLEIGVGRTRHRYQTDVLTRQLAQSESAGELRGQRQPGVAREMGIIEGDTEAGGRVRDSHLTGDLLLRRLL